MGKINVLDKHTAELIAAGEVVERPASVIKELLENSIDAGAHNITVEIKNGGTTFMRVTDDGSGFMREDVKKAFLRHATSKVSHQRDLDSIATLGFRGEALASISAVAKVELITLSEDEEIGTYYVINGGEEETFEDAGCSKGTTLIIRDLFYNIPARQKFLKKDVAEGNAVALVIDRLALSHPEVSFTFIRDSKQVLKTAGDGKLYSAIYSVFGREFANSLIEVDYELSGIKVEGYISRPEYAKTSRSMQTFFVNSRYVRSRTAAAALEEASKGSVMVGKFLCCVLNISIPYGMVDVNVHPAKIEVRFVNERPLFDAVYHATKAALYKGDKRKEATLNSKFKENPFAQFDLRTKDNKRDSTPVPNVKNTSNFDAIKVLDITDKPQTTASESVLKKNEPIKTDDKNSFLNTSVTQKATTFIPQYKRTLNVADSSKITNYRKSLDIIKESDDVIIQDIVTPSAQREEITADNAVNNDINNEITIEININSDSATEDIKEEISIIKSDIPDFRYIGEVFRTYIIIEIDKELILIDKHALHERIIYNQLKENATSNTQYLLTPESVILNKTDYTAAVENLEMFEECGFEIEDFGASTLLVRAAPQYIENEDISDTITEMAGYISMNKRDIKTEKMDWIFHNIACRAAIKAGNRSTEPELIALVKQMLSDDNLRYCPHGRPVSVILKKSEIEKLFGRM